jgi:hypothetical protein
MDFETQGGIKMFQLPIPIEVTLANHIEQPRLSQKVQLAEEGKKWDTVTFSLDDGMDNKITKKIFLEFDLTNDTDQNANKIAKTVKKGDGIKKAKFDEDTGTLTVIIDRKTTDATLKFRNDLQLDENFDLQASFALTDADFIRKKSTKQGQDPDQMDILLTGDAGFDELDFFIA